MTMNKKDGIPVITDIDEFEPELNSVFSLGGVEYKCVKDPYGNLECPLCELGKVTCSAYCCAEERKDETNVMFILHNKE